MSLPFPITLPLSERAYDQPPVFADSETAIFKFFESTKILLPTAYKKNIPGKH
ncbi:MAG: hypothetical protein ACUVTX_10655 [Bacteroidales bacterium]